MTNYRHYLLEKREQEITTIYKKPEFFPVRFQLPDEVKDKVPAIETRKYEGQKIMRFYTPPVPGVTLIHDGFKWVVVDVEHTVQVKGSPKGDLVPIIVAECIGVVES
jgi:hypothetical protein